MQNAAVKLLAISAFCLLHSAFAAARVVRVDVTSRGDYWNGTYERIQGRITYALDPANPHNAAIADLTQPVEFTGDVDIVRPKNGGNGVVFVNVPNRGGRFFIRDSNPDEWYLRQGFTLAEVGWQFDVRPDARLLRLDDLRSSRRACHPGQHRRHGVSGRRSEGRHAHRARRPDGAAPQHRKVEM